MEILAISALPQISNTGENTSKSKKQTENSNTFSSIAVTFEHIEINVESVVYEPPQSQISSGRNNEEIDNAETLRLKEEIRAEIVSQVENFLEAFFSENSEAAAQVGKGEIPEYFNVENTANRILNIYFSRFEEGEDKQAFAERALTIIEQAYGEAADIAGELPGIVLETRERVRDILERFANGEDVSNIIGKN